MIVHTIDVALAHPVRCSGYAQDLGATDLFKVINDLSVSGTHLRGNVMCLIDDDVVEGVGFLQAFL